MRVFEAMSDQVRTVPPTMVARDAFEIMKNNGVHHLVVTDTERVVGVVSDRDLSPRRRVPAASADVTIDRLMSSPVATIQKGETVRKAANLMEGRTIGCLPVMDNSRLVGIITTSDLLRLLGQGGDRRKQGTRTTLNHLVPHKKRQVGDGKW